MSSGQGRFFFFFFFSPLLNKCDSIVSRTWRSVNKPSRGKKTTSSVGLTNKLKEERGEGVMDV